MGNIVVVDVDGTIANGEHRQHFLKQTPKNWDAFFDACDLDTPHKDICDLVVELSVSHPIVFCSGRTEKTRSKTIAWLTQNLWLHPMYSNRLLMRADGDFRHDNIIKPELLSNAGITLQQIAFVLDDRDSVVAMWRSLGLRVLQVAPGDF